MQILSYLFTVVPYSWGGVPASPASPTFGPKADLHKCCCTPSSCNLRHLSSLDEHNVRSCLISLMKPEGIQDCNHPREYKMEHLKTLLIANRAEIATRILKTAKCDCSPIIHLPPYLADTESPSSRSKGIRTIAIYTEPDAASTHVSQADVAVLLPGSPANAYLDG